jgi:hypothetical protein
LQLPFLLFTNQLKGRYLLRELTIPILLFSHFLSIKDNAHLQLINKQFLLRLSYSVSYSGTTGKQHILKQTMMKKNLALLIIAFTLSASFVSTVHAQSSAATEEIEKALVAMENNIVKLCGIMVDFAAVKSSLLLKQEDGTLIYNVKDCDMMLASKQYIVVKPNGTAYYIAIYSGDEKKLQMSSGTFKSVRAPFKIETDKEKSTANEDIQSLFFQGIKVGSYMLDAKKGEGRMTIGFL